MRSNIRWSNGTLGPALLLIGVMIVSVDPDRFTVISGTTPRTLAYADVVRLRRGGMRTGAKIAIAAAIAVGVRLMLGFTAEACAPLAVSC